MVVLPDPGAQRVCCEYSGECASRRDSHAVKYTQEDLELEVLNASAPQWELCLRFAASHVTTMGSDSVVPVNSWGYAISWMQMVCRRPVGRCDSGRHAQ